MIIRLRDFISNVFYKLFQQRKSLKLGIYGPPNAGKTTLANRICRDWIGEEMGSVSKIPHETRNVQQKEKIKIKHKRKELTFNLIDTPGIATKGVIEAIKWLDGMDAVLVVVDATLNPYSQVNLTIIGNLAARNIPVLVVANKLDIRKANIKKVESA